VCSDHYIITPKLHNTLIDGRLPKDLKIKHKHLFKDLKFKNKDKFICLNESSVYLVTFRIVFKDNKPILVYHYFSYSDIFIDLLLMYLISRHDFKNSLLYKS
jgi:hypothetical protein